MVERDVIRFESFEYRRASRELVRSGTATPVPQRAVAVLDRLLASPGELVTKEDLLAAAWEGVHVTPTSLTEAISRLRAALGDDAATPRYVETLPGRGYRWIGPRPRRPKTRARRWRLTVAAGFLLCAVVVWKPVRGPEGRTAIASWSLTREPTATLGALPFEVSDVFPSPDGERLVLGVPGPDGSELWLADWTGDRLRRLSTRGSNFEAVWSPDGSSVVWANDARGTFDLVHRRVDGGGPETLLWAAPGDQFPESWSADGTRLVYSERGLGNGFDLAALRRSPSGAWVTESLRATPHDEYLGSYSPDGRWLTYESDRSGRPEIWIETAVASGDPRIVSSRGGRAPFWAADGASLYYLEGTDLVRLALRDTAAGPRRAVAGIPPVLRIRPTRQGFVALLAGAG